MFQSSFIKILGKIFFPTTLWGLLKQKREKYSIILQVKKLSPIKESELITKPSLKYHFLTLKYWLVVEYLMLILTPVQQLTSRGWDRGGAGGHVYLEETSP